MGGYLGMFLQSLQDSGQMELARQSAARQQQELELQQQKQKNAEQIDLASLLGQGATLAPPAGTAPTEMSGMGGISLTDPTSGSDPSREVNVGGRQVRIETPEERNAADTAQAVSRGTALNKIGKVPLTAQGSAAMEGMLAPGTPIDPSHAAYLGTMLSANKRADSAQARLDAQQNQAPRVVGHTITADDSGHQTETITFSDGSTQEKALQSRGKTKEKAAGGDGGGGERAATQNALLLEKRSAIKDYRDATKEENDLNNERLRIGTALNSGQHYVDKKGNLTAFDPGKDTPEQISAMHADMRNRYDEATSRLAQVISEKNDAIQRAGGHPSVSTDEAVSRLRAGHAHNMNTALNPPAPTPNAGAPALPKTSAALAKPKVTDLGSVKAFAAKTGMPLDAAIRQVQSEGFQVKGAQ